MQIISVLCLSVSALYHLLISRNHDKKKSEMIKKVLNYNSGILFLGKTQYYDGHMTLFI